MNTATGIQLERLAAVPTASISDALDRLGLDGQLQGIAPLSADQRVCGPAFTVSYESIADEPGTVGDFLDDVEPGSVVVIDNHSRADCTVWGGIMTGAAHARGVAATVIDGACRDVSVALETGYPIWSGSRYMRTGKDRVRMIATGRTLQIGHSTVRPGDLICGDADGVLAVPVERVDEVLALAESIEAAESRIVAAVRAGATLREARATFGYHALQTRR